MPDLPCGPAGHHAAHDRRVLLHAEEMKATTAKTSAKIMFMITPAEMMAIRWGTLFAR